MAYLIKFKSKYTKGKWMSQKHLHSRLSSANRSAAYLRKNNKDLKGKPIGLKVSIRKVDARKPPYNKMTMLN